MVNDGLHGLVYQTVPPYRQRDEFREDLAQER